MNIKPAVLLSSFIAWSACQPKTQTEPKPPPASVPTSAIAPKSEPTSKIASLPTSTSIPASTSAPTSEPASTSAPSSAASAETQPAEEGEILYVDLELVETKKGYKAILPDASNTGQDPKLENIAEGYSEGCELAATSTALVSYVCTNKRDWEPPDERAAGPFVETTISATTKAWKNGGYEDVSIDDIFSNTKELEKLLEKEGKEAFDGESGFTIDNFTLNEDSITFYASTSYFGGEYELFLDEDDKLIKWDAWPLSMMEHIGSYPEDFSNPETLTGKLTKLPFDAKSLPVEIVVEGKSITGFHWMDPKNNTENYFIFSWVQSESKDKLKKTTYLYANHFTNTPGTFTNRIKIIDKQEKCEAENKAKFIEEKLRLTDLDLDGIGEVSFAYQLGCITGPGAVPYKWFIAEGGEKYALRGTAELAEDGTLTPGEKKTDKLFEKVPSIFLKMGEFMY